MVGVFTSSRQPHPPAAFNLMGGKLVKLVTLEVSIQHGALAPSGGDSCDDQLQI